MIAFLSVFLWALNAIFLKEGLAGSNSSVFNWVRFSFALLFMPFFRPSAVWWQLVLVSLFWNFINFNSFVLGLDEGLSITKATAIYQTNAFFGLIFCFLLNKDKLSRRGLIGMTASFFGVSIFLQDGWQDLSGTISELLILTAGLSWGVGFALMKKFNIKADFGNLVWLSFYAFVFQSIFLAVQGENITQFITTNTLVYASLAFFLGSIAANSLWLRSSQYYRVSTMTGLILLLPILTGCFGYLVYNDHLTTYELIGALLTLAGVVYNSGVQIQDLYHRKAKTA